MWFLVEKSSIQLKATGRLFRLPWLLQTQFCSDIPLRKSKIAPLQDRKMIDRVRMWAKGGDGGNGCSSFRRSRHNRRGRADGGNGGRGGDVILECSPSIWDFSGLQRHVNAKRGGHGSSKNLIGSRGADKVVHVPVGTVIHLVEGQLPSAVEKPVSEELDPWDMPNSPTDDSSELTEEIDSTNSSTSPSKTEEKIPPTKATLQQLSHDSITSRMSVVNSKFTIRTEDPDSSMDNEDEDENEDYLPGEEHEEGYETDAASAMQYNVAELTEPGQQLVIAYGGDGGLGNISTTKPFTRKPNDVDAKVDDDNDDDADGDDGEKPAQRIGMPGAEVVLVLELKSIADVGLVGMPNAGKSTLLGAMSRARPTIGDYAFTTLRPNLGNVSYEDFSITVADIPGLISGAHDNRGLGHDFLRHIERTKVLAYVVDLVAAIDGRPGIPPWKQLHDLVLELEFYREGLSKRPSLVVANKIDEAGADEAYEELKRRVRGVHIYPVCAVLEQGVSEVKDGLRMLVNGEVLSKLRLDDIVVD